MLITPAGSALTGSGDGVNKSALRCGAQPVPDPVFSAFRVNK